MSDVTKSHFIEPGGREAELFVYDLQSSLIASGGYGYVWRARHKTYQDVAVKVIALQGDLEPAIEKFKSEIELLLLANISDHITTCLGWFTHQSYAGIVMTFGTCGSLFNLLHNHHHTDIPRCLLHRILHHICLGINFLHSLRKDQVIIHGDLKTSNVVLTKDLNAQICDFGGAKLTTISAARSADALRHDEYNVMTILYTAPEVLNNPRLRRGRATDMWSYGIITSECRFRQPPYQQYDHTVRLQAARTFQPPHDIPVGPNTVDAPLMRLRNNCLSRDPQHRPHAYALVNNWTNILPYDEMDAMRQAVEVRQAMGVRQPDYSGPCCNFTEALTMQRYGRSRYSSDPQSFDSSNFTGTTGTSPLSSSPAARSSGLHPGHGLPTNGRSFMRERRVAVRFPIDAVGALSMREKWRMVSRYLFGGNTATANRQRGQDSAANKDKKMRKRFWKKDKIPTFVCLMIGDMSVGRHWSVNSFIKGNASTDACGNHPKKHVTLEDGRRVQVKFEFGLNRSNRADVVIFSFALDNLQSFENLCLKWIPESTEKFGEGIPRLIVGFKSDLREKGFQHIAPEEVGHDLAARSGATSYWECSGRNGYNIHAMFNQAIDIATRE